MNSVPRILHIDPDLGDSDRADSALDDHPVAIVRVADTIWHAVADDLVVGRGEATRRPDGRLFLSVDAWRSPIFDALADAMLAALPRPLHTIVDEADADSMSGWQRLGFTVRIREWTYVVPTDPAGLDAAPPPGVEILPLGTARPDLLRDAYDAIRAQIEAGAGWDSVPAEIIGRPDGSPPDPSRFAVAAQSGRYGSGRYIGLLRLVPLRQPEIRLIAVRSECRRRGVARALLGQVLSALHRNGTGTAATMINETNQPATALFAGIGARRTTSTVELVLR